MTLPAVDYLNQNTRTEGEMKLALEDFLKGLKQVPGVGVTEQALTLATDAITPAVGASGIISIDTEAAAAADNLANIVLTNVPDGSCLLLRIANNARVVTVKHLAGGSGQLSLRSAADLVLSATTQWLCVKRTGTLLEEQWRSGKEFLKSPTADSLTLTGGLNEARGNIAMHATTMDLFATTSPNILDGTGSAVTITAIVNAPQAGAKRRLYPIVGTIITHGATFSVDGNASYTTLAGDCLEFEAITTSTFDVHIIKQDATPVAVTGLPIVTAVTSDYVVIADTSDSGKPKRALASDLAGVAATQAEQEAASSIIAMVTPGRQHFHPSAAKSWIRFNGTGTPSIGASYNITSITDGGVGAYTITIATDMSSGEYAVLATAKGANDATNEATITCVGTLAVGTYFIETTNSNGARIDPQVVSSVTFGDQ